MDDIGPLDIPLEYSAAPLAQAVPKEVPSDVTSTFVIKVNLCRLFLQCCTIRPYCNIIIPLNFVGNLLDATLLIFQPSNSLGQCH